MQKRSWKKKLVAVGLIGGVAVGGTAAYALWSANGSGSGSSKALTAQTISVNAATATADLYPGFTGGDLAFTLTNNNPYPVTFTTMSAGTVTSSNASGCPSSNVTVATPVISIVVPAGSTNLPATITDAVTMVSAAPDACQGVTFTVALTLTGSQS